MADTNNLSKFLTDVADAIRSKKNTTDLIPASEFDTEILSIKGGDSEQIVSQLASQVTGVRIKPSTAGTVKIQWDIPDDETYAGVDISWATERTPTFPIDEKNIISIDSSVIDSTLIEGLEPSTLYGFIVMAKNKDGLRNTTKSSNNTAMGYVSEMMDYIEVDVMENYTRFEKSNVVNDFIICSATVASGYPGCYKLNVTTGGWELIYETKSNFRILDPNLDTGDIILIARETSSNWPGFYYYDLTTNEMVAVNEDNNMYQIYYRFKQNNLVYLSTYNGTYTFNIDTKEFVRVNSDKMGTVIWANDSYIFYTFSSNDDVGIKRLTKTTNTVTTVVGTSYRSFSTWNTHITKTGEVYFNRFYVSSSDNYDYNVRDYLYKVNPITGDLTNIAITPNGSSTISGQMVELDNCFFFLRTSGAFYKYDMATQTMESIPYNIYAGGSYDYTRTITYDNEYFIVAADPTEIIDPEGTTASMGVGAIMKYSKLNNVIEKVYQSSITRASSQSNMHAEVYPTKTKLFMKIDNNSNMEIIMYDSVTKEISLVFSGAYQWNISTNGSDTDENEVLLLRRSSAGTSYRFNPATNAFDIPLTDSFGTTYSSAGKYHTISGAAPITVYTSTSGNAGTYYFDSDHNLHKISDTGSYNTLLDGEYEAFLIHTTATTYKYDRMSKSFSPMENVGGTQLTENSFFYKSLNQLNIYNYNGETKSYSALEGNYTAATVTANKGYVHSTASNKLLVALTSFDIQPIEKKNKYIMIDKIGNVYHSINGVDWTYKMQIPDIMIVNNSICYGNGKIIVVGEDSESNVVVYCSTDGLIWTKGILNIPYIDNISRPKYIAYGNNVYVLTVFNAIYYSIDGINWTQTYIDSTSMSYGHRWLCFGYGIFIVASRDRSVIVYSTDGINWSRKSIWTSSADKPYDIKFVNDRFVAVGGYDGEANSFYSLDGLTWEVMTITLNRTLQKVCGGNNIYLACVGTTGVRSTNGTSWEESTITLPQTFSEIYFANNLFVGLSAVGIYTSTDGVTWSASTEYEIKAEASAISFGKL